MSDVAVSVEKLSKLYRLGLKETTPDTLTGTLFSWLKSPAKNLGRIRSLTRFHPDENSDDVLWALRDISFEVKRGEVVGFIGRNGAGKSTLLKILARITEPTRGRVIVRGRVGSLLEVGTGFHPELSGRENIYMNGTILGMTKADIDKKFDEIVEFSGVSRFLDTPVKRFSSGMTVRLAFAVAAHLDPEILIVDEVLAVGDAEFQAKCLGKMESVSRTEGKTVLFVSHNMGAIRNLCSRALLLRQGELVADGETSSTVGAYLAYLDQGSADPFNNNSERSGNGKARFKSARILDDDGLPITKVMAGLPLTFELGYLNPVSLQNLDSLMTIYNSNGMPVTHLSSWLSSKGLFYGPQGVIRCHIPRVPFPPGRYRVAAALQQGGANCDHIPNILSFEVAGSVFFPQGRTPNPRYCAVLVDHMWSSADESFKVAQ
jgi:lipopolysaccharide transport system ATP-binding protein